MITEGNLVKKEEPDKVSHQAFSYLSKMRGKGRSPLQVNSKDVLTGFIGGTITIFILALLTQATSTPWLIASFGASSVLAFGLWNSPLSQPRNIIGGHLVSTFVGLLVLHLFGNQPWSIAIGVGLAIALMMLTKTTHPPAGADPIIVMLGTSHSWTFLFTPVLSGTIIIVLVALIVNNLRKDRHYPVFWI